MPIIGQINKYEGGIMMKEINLKVEGMMCTGCENRIQNAVKNMNGIKSVKADHTTGTVKIEAEDGIEESKIKEKIENIGFDVL